MKNVIITFILLSFTSQGFGQSTNEGVAVPGSTSADVDTPQVIVSSNDYFTKRKSFISPASKTISSNEQKSLDQIVNNIKAIDNNSSEYNYVEYVNRGRTIEAFEYLKKADAAYPNNVDFYDDFMYHAELVGDKNTRKVYSKKLHESNTIHVGIMEYNYNVLMSIEKDGILITNGNDDTYPLFIWQDISNVRTDVTIVNIDMLNESYYVDALKKKKNLDIKIKENNVETALYLLQKNGDQNLYIGHTISPTILKELQLNLYLSGLTYKYSKRTLNNVIEAKTRFEQDFKLDQIERKSSNSTVNNLNFNYALPLLTFIEYYHLNGEKAKAKSTRKLLITISKNAGKESFILEYLSNHDL